MFVSSADRNLLLLIATELRLAPLHALHDTSYYKYVHVSIHVTRERVRTYVRRARGSIEEVGHDHVRIESGRVAPYKNTIQNLSHDLRP